MIGALGAKNLTTATVRGLHVDGPIVEGEPHGQRAGRHRDHRLAIQTARTHLASLTGFWCPPPEGTPPSDN
jgi:hypothetical protein